MQPFEAAVRLMHMRASSAALLSVVVVVAVAVAASGCTTASSHPQTAAGGPTPSRTSVATVDGRGEVTGTLRVYGGPLNPTTHKQALNGDPMPHIVVTATAGDGHRTVAKTDAAGVFVFRLRPGRYVLSGDCGGRTSVIVRANAMVHHDLICAVP